MTKKLSCSEGTNDKADDDADDGGTKKICLPWSGEGRHKYHQTKI